jgi:hypothetical protein
MEAFHVRILRRLAGLNMSDLDALLVAPGQEMSTGKLRPVVAANRSRTGCPTDGRPAQNMGLAGFAHDREFAQ